MVPVEVTLPPPPPDVIHQEVPVFVQGPTPAPEVVVQQRQVEVMHDPEVIQVQNPPRVI